MIGNGNFFRAVADIIRYEEDSVDYAANIIRSEVIESILTGWQIFPEIPNIANYYNWIREEETPVDLYLMQAFANIYHINLHIHVNTPVYDNSYVVLITDENRSPEIHQVNIFLNYNGESYTPLSYNPLSNSNHEYIAIGDLLDTLLNHDSYTLLEYFINAGLIDPYAVDHNGNNLLHLAAMHDSTEIIAELVLRTNLNLEAINNNGYMPYEYASTDLIEELLTPTKETDPPIYMPGPESQYSFGNNNDDDQPPNSGTIHLNYNDTTPGGLDHKIIYLDDIYPVISCNLGLIRPELDLNKAMNNMFAE